MKPILVGILSNPLSCSAMLYPFPCVLHPLYPLMHHNRAGVHVIECDNKSKLYCRKKRFHLSNSHWAGAPKWGFCKKDFFSCRKRVWKIDHYENPCVAFSLWVDLLFCVPSAIIASKKDKGRCMRMRRSFFSPFSFLLDCQDLKYISLLSVPALRVVKVYHWLFELLNGFCLE